MLSNCEDRRWERLSNSDLDTKDLYSAIHEIFSGSFLIFSVSPSRQSFVLKIDLSVETLLHLYARIIKSIKKIFNTPLLVCIMLLFLAVSVPPDYSFDRRIIDVQNLPIMEFNDTIINYVRNHPVTLIQGDTGCGKSTQVKLAVLFTKKKLNHCWICSCLDFRCRSFCWTIQWDEAKNALSWLPSRVGLQPGPWPSASVWNASGTLENGLATRSVLSPDFPE